MKATFGELIFLTFKFNVMSYPVLGAMNSLNICFVVLKVTNVFESISKATRQDSESIPVPNARVSTSVSMGK